MEVKKSRLELLQEYKNQKILKQKNLNNQPTTAKKIVRSTTKAPTKPEVKVAKSPIKNASKTINIDQKDTKSDSKTRDDIKHVEIEQDTERQDSQSSILLQIELESQKQQLSDLLQENALLKQNQQLDLNSEKQDLIQQLLSFVREIKTRKDGWDLLLESLDNIDDQNSLKLDSFQFDETKNPFLINNSEVSTDITTEISTDIAIEISTELQNVKQELIDLKQELKDAYEVIAHYELTIKEHEIMNTVKESELKELESELKSSMLTNKELQHKVQDLETEIKDLKEKELLNDLIDLPDTSVADDSLAEKHVQLLIGRSNPCSKINEVGPIFIKPADHSTEAEAPKIAKWMERRKD